MESGRLVLRDAPKRANDLLARGFTGAAPERWCRGVAFALGDLRTEAAHPRPATPLQVREVTRDLTGTP
ncbi:hypothetical protein ACFY1L_54530 [Streptomyces sp. NPDC001663]|uniref:hypothetical protein n=1 Tax=Streptomyces sp. NPDC001663 TaxID=3364597 RepID=UPI0036AD87E9